MNPHSNPRHPSFISRVASAFLLLLSAGAVLNAAIQLKIAAPTQVVESFNKWNKETPWEKITNFASPYANRPTTDLVLQLQALKEGGLDFTFTLIEDPNNERARLEVVNGSADLMAETVWDSDVVRHGDALLSSAEPLIAKGDFTKGIYVLPGNEAAMKVKTIEALQKLTGAVVSTWNIDVATLTALKLKGLEKPSRLENVYMMIQKKRADFVLLEFSSLPDMSQEVSGVTLIPIPGVKVALEGSRPFIISAKSPNAKALQDAFAKGMSAMKAAGRIDRAFKESGFFNSKVEGWKRLF